MPSPGDEEEGSRLWLHSSVIAGVRPCDGRTISVLCTLDFGTEVPLNVPRGYWHVYSDNDNVDGGFAIMAWLDGSYRPMCSCLPGRFRACLQWTCLSVPRWAAVSQRWGRSDDLQLPRYLTT